MWRKAFNQSVVPLSRTASIVPLAPALDGRTFFASIWTLDFSGVARIDAETNEVKRIKAFPNPDTDQAGGSFDGRWLVWREYHSLSNWDDFTIWAWDSRVGSLTQIGAAKQQQDGMFWPSNWRNPDVRNGIATWEQGAADGGVGEVHIFTLPSGPDRVVRRGHPQGSFFLRSGKVVWPESPKPGARTVFRGVTISGAAFKLPVALRRIRGVSALVTDGRSMAYPNADFTSLWWSPALSTTPQRVVAAGYGDNIDNSVQVSGRYILFGIAPHTYLADTVTRRYVQINAGGWGRLNTRALVFLRPAARKASHAVSDVLLIRIKALPPIPSCK